MTSVPFTQAIPYERLPRVAKPDVLRVDQTEWALPTDLDLFFTRIYKYWQGKGFFANLLHEVANLLALLFFLCFSAFLLFFVKWTASFQDCDHETCDLTQLYLQNPFESTRLTLWTMLRLMFLTLFGLYWLGSLLVTLSELRSSWTIMQFCRMKLGISEEHIKWISWGEMVHRLVLIQQTTRLCLQRELSEHDIINRMLRKENYLVGMINKGILRLNVPLVGFKRRYLMTKMMEWSLRWGLLNPMFDQNFEIRRSYRTDPTFLSWKFRQLALINLLLAPFLLVFLGIYFLMLNVERLYHSPSTVTERSWSPYALWSLREFNETEHHLRRRLAQSLTPAQDYLNQFPNYSLRHVGKLISFVLQSFMALLLWVALIDDALLEGRELMGRNLVWWATVLMVALKIARGLAPEHAAMDPDVCMQQVVHHTHFCPKLWRGHARLKEVQESFQRMFRYRALNFTDEVLSVFLAPYILYYVLPQSSGLIVQFLQRYTVHIEGVGHICSMAAFDFEKHGNRNYGSVHEAAKLNRSKQGKMEKSFLTFVGHYPLWQPPPSGQQFLNNLQPFMTSSPSADSPEAGSLHENGTGGVNRTGSLTQGPVSESQSQFVAAVGDRLEGSRHRALQSLYLSRSVMLPRPSGLG